MMVWVNVSLPLLLLTTDLRFVKKARVGQIGPAYDLLSITLSKGCELRVRLLFGGSYFRIVLMSLNVTHGNLFVQAYGRYGPDAHVLLIKLRIYILFHYFFLIIIISYFMKMSMSAHHKLTTVLQMVYAQMLKDPFNVNVNQDLQEMAKRVMVGQEIKLSLIYFPFVYFYI